MIYLADLFHSPYTSAGILDVETNPNAILSGTFPIRIPDELGVVPTPYDVSGVLTEKYSTLLAFYTNFTRIAYDHLLDTTGLSITPSTKGEFGPRGHIRLYPGCVLESIPVGLMAPNAAQCLVTWECFTFEYQDTNDAPGDYSYTTTAASNLTCDVSFDGGANWLTTMDGMVLNIPVPLRGINFLIRFTNSGISKVGLGSWSLLY